MTRDELLALRNVKIAAPCPVTWESMTGDDRTRFCASCQLTVHRFAAMTTVEVMELLQKARTERVCAQLFVRADGSVMTKDCPSTWQLAQRRAVEVTEGRWWLWVDALTVLLALALCLGWLFKDNLKMLLAGSPGGALAGDEAPTRYTGSPRSRGPGLRAVKSAQASSER